MPDIFGREAQDYEHIRAYQDAGLWETRQAVLAAQRPNAIPHHDFDALSAWGRNGVAENIPERYARQEVNAQAIGYMTDNLLAIQAMIDEIMYLQYRLPDFVPLNMNIPDGATSYGVRVGDRAGRGRFITNPGGDAPVASVSTRLKTHELHYAGIDGAYSVEDVRNAMFGGTPLEIRTMEAAIRGAMEHMEEVVLTGSDQLPGDQAKGLINFTTGTGGVNLQTQAANSKFSDLTGSQIRDLINGDISSVIDASRETLGTNIQTGMTVYLPTEGYNLAATKFVGDVENVSAMSAVMQQSAWAMRTGNAVDFRSVAELKGAGAATGDDRMITAVRDDRIFEAGVSIPPRVLRVLDKGRQICVQVEYKFSTLFMKRPTLIRYRDKI